MKIFKWVVIIGGIILGATLVGSFLNVATTVISAPGKVISKTLQTDNIIHNYEWFYDVNASYDARYSQVVQFKSLFQEEEDKSERSRLRIEMAAMQQSCRDLAAKYNANSEKMNTSIFKGWSLPSTLSLTDCN